MNIDLSKVQLNESVSLTSRDRQFFNELVEFMNAESTQIGRQPTHERFVVFRLAFEKLIERSSLYRNLFRSIKQEYESCINALESGAEEVRSMTDDLQRLVLQPKTFLLRQKRCMELEDKLSIIEEENRQLQQEIDRIEQSIEQEEIDKISAQQENQTENAEIRTGHRRIPGLTFAEETNLRALDKYFDFLREKCNKFESGLSSKYTSKERRHEIQRIFEEKQRNLDQEREQRLILRNRLRLYHLAHRTIQKCIDDEINQSPRSNRERILLEDAILAEIYKSSNIFQRNEQNDDDESDGQSSYDKEAGVLLNHIELFLDLFERGNYKEASFIAASSPRGVLRNFETLLKFKELKKSRSEEISPLLFHCQILVETALEAPFKPDILISLECTKAAIGENQSNLLYKWIAENRLTLSTEMAETIERFQLFDLAEFVYRRMGAHFQAALCLLKRGSSKRCVDFLLSLNEPVASTKESLTKLFNLNPSVDFALNIMKSSSTKYFQADEIVLLFLQVDQHLNGIRFVEELMNEPEFSSEKEQIDKLKTSFDLLKKYSFLVEEKVRPEEKENPIDDEYSEIHCTEKELAHRLTRRITRSALEKIRRTRRCSVSSVPTLERIDEDPRPFSPRTDSPRSIEKTLCHEDFFNDFPESLYFTDDVHLKTDENPSTD